jgi:predicted DNA-binding transcriptional regulator AlpA
MQEDGNINIIRLPELLKKLGGVHRETVRRWEVNNGFPARIVLGHRTIGWDLSAVNDWLMRRAKNK